MTQLDLLVILAIAGTFLGLSVRVLFRRSREHAERPIQAALLDEPVRLPATPGYPETWTAYPDTDGRLARLADTTWPHEEYLDVLDCPTPERSAYRSVAAAHEGEGHQVITYDCGCGSVHARQPRRRRLPSFPPAYWALTGGILAAAFGLAVLAAHLDSRTQPADQPTVTKTGTWPTAVATVYPERSP